MSYEPSCEFEGSPLFPCDRPALPVDPKFGSSFSIFFFSKKKPCPCCDTHGKQSHDWPEAESVKILSHLRHVATPGQTKLVLVELTLNELSPPNPCPPPYIFSYYIDMQSELSLCSLSRLSGGCSPFLIRCGDSFDCRGFFFFLSFFRSYEVLCALNAQERTESGYEALGKKSGWRLVKTYKTGLDGDEGPYRHFEFMPA